MSDREQGAGFWRTLPGVLSAVAACITAVTGLVIGLSSAGSDDSQTSARPTATASVDRDRKTADAVAGNWAGDVRRGGGEVYQLSVTIDEGCELEETCGSLNQSDPRCIGDISFKAVVADRYEFSVDHFSANSSKVCKPGAGEYLTPRGDDALRYRTGWDPAIRGTLHLVG